MKCPYIPKNVFKKTLRNFLKYPRKCTRKIYEMSINIQ